MKVKEVNTIIQYVMAIIYLLWKRWLKIQWPDWEGSMIDLEPVSRQVVKHQSMIDSKRALYVINGSRGSQGLRKKIGLFLWALARVQHIINLPVEHFSSPAFGIVRQQKWAELFLFKDWQEVFSLLETEAFSFIVAHFEPCSNEQPLLNLKKRHKSKAFLWSRFCGLPF